MAAPALPECTDRRAPPRLQGSGKESKGKRMAMKFMTKLGSKEKFVKNVPGLGRLTHSQDAEVRGWLGGQACALQIS